MSDHRCSWDPIGGNKVVCHGCNTVSDITTLLANAKATAAQQAKIDLLAKQLFARELKKDAHERYYAWIVQNSPAGTLANTESKQGVLL